MPEYLTPGVYIEEINTGPRPIEGVSTSTAAMVGRTERGPAAPMLITSWLEYQRWYGSYLPTTISFLPYAVQGFFDNGGQRLFLARAVDRTAVHAFADIGNAGQLHIMAIGEGAWGNRIYVRVVQASKWTAQNNLFRLDVLYYSSVTGLLDPIVDPFDPDEMSNPDRRAPDLAEVYDNLTHTPGAPNNVEATVNASSQLIRVWFPALPPAPVQAQPLEDFAALANGTGDDENIATATMFDAYEGDPDINYDQNLATGLGLPEDRNILLFGQGRGLRGIEDIDEVSLIHVPDEVLFPIVGTISPITDLVITQCERLRDRFAVVASYPGLRITDQVRPPRDTSYAGYYYPWVSVFDPVTNRPRMVPPGGYVMGLIARTDIERGVYKAPANEVLRDAVGLEFPVNKEAQAILNPRGVNCVRDFRSDGRGIRVWGARTMSSDTLWQYINVRRLFIFIEESIEEGTQYVVFEPNDEPLWASVRRTISSFLIGVWRSGALMGLTQEEAFFVKCDRTTMTEDDILNGRLVCYIGVAPVRPAEFVIFRISQKTAEAPA